MGQQNKYAYDEDNVKAILHWALTAQLPTQIELSESENILDVQKYIQANIHDINQHFPDPFYNPAIDRLYRLKEFVENNNK
jgi:hypothetical protein